jgi:creatinase/prolidase-like protein
MKRGLVVLDPAEVSEAERAGRVLRLQRRLAAEEITIALDYADVHRSDDLAYLTNLCLYWNEGILAVPVVGEPTFVMKLSPRVHPWMRRSSTLTDLRSGKGFTALVEGLLEGMEPGVLGLVDAGLWPATAVEEVAAAAPGWEIRPLGGLVRELRLVPSAAERVLLRDAQAHLEAALSAAAGAGVGDGERIALVEQALRGAGFTDVLAEVVHGPDGVSSVDVTGQYRFCWVRGARLVEGASAPWVAGLEKALAGLPAGAVGSVAVVHQADLSTGGDYADPGEPLPAGAVVVVAVEVLFPDGGRVAVTETVPVEAS